MRYHGEELHKCRYTRLLQDMYEERKSGTTVEGILENFDGSENEAAKKLAQTTF